MKLSRLSIRHFGVIVLLVIHLLPVWLFKYTATQDGPVHVHNAYVLKTHHQHENYILREVYKPNPTLFPNWASHALMAMMMYLFPPLVCEKILFSLCISLLPLSLFYFLSGVQRNKTLFGLVGFIYAYNYLLHMGFYNFALSVSLFFFSLGYWWRQKNKLSPKTIVILYLLLIGVYLTHFQSYALLTLSITFFGIFSFVYQALLSRWGYEIDSDDRAASSQQSEQFMANLKSSLLFLGTMVPAHFILMLYYLAKREGGGYHRSFESLTKYLLSIGSIVSFRDDHLLIGQILMVVFTLAFLITIVIRIQQVYTFRRSKLSELAAARLWTKVITPTDQFLLISIILTIIYFKSPWSLRSGGMWISDRIHIYIFLVLLPFFSINLHKFVNYAFSVVLIGLSLWHLGYNIQTYYLLNQDVEEALSSVGMLEPHTVLSSRPASWGGKPDSAEWDFKYIVPFEHIEGYLALQNGVAYLQNYEPGTDHFPLRYKNRKMSADYVLVWRTEYDNSVDLMPDHELINSNNYNRLYRRKKMAVDDKLWANGQNVVSFDMQPIDGPTAPDHLTVHKDTFYIDGKYGWLTMDVLDQLPVKGGGFELRYWDSSATSEENDYSIHRTQIPEPYRDSVWGKEDGVFRVALPNGVYEVTCYFRANQTKPIEINLIANGQMKIRKLQLQSPNKTLEQRYQISIIDERLTQVIFTRGKGGYQYWGWSGFSIKRHK